VFSFFGSSTETESKKYIIGRIVMEYKFVLLNREIWRRGLAWLDLCERFTGWFTKVIRPSTVQVLAAFLQGMLKDPRSAPA